MASIPKKVAERLVTGIKRFQPILAAAKARDVGESDTVTIVTDMLADVFGYDKYSEVTSEFAIRGTYCDLAIKIDGELKTLIEVKAIGLDLKDAHAKQAVDYAANQGVDWVLLTNGIVWRVYRVIFAKPIDNELILETNFSALSARNENDLESIFLWSKEAWVRSALGDYHTQKQALSRFFIAALLTTEPLLDTLRRELRRHSPDVRISQEQIRDVLLNEVLKREVAEGEKADESRKRIAKGVAKALRNTRPKSSPEDAPSVALSDTQGAASHAGFLQPIIQDDVASL